MIDFSKYKSQCHPRQKVIISQENRCRHIAHNVDMDNIRHFKLDGEVITGPEEQRCDYLLLNDTKRTAYYIKLKGSDIQKAIEQIKNSERIIKDSLQEYLSFYRIVYRTGTHSVNNHNVIKWKQKCGKDPFSGKAIAIVKHEEHCENI